LPPLHMDSIIHLLDALEPPHANTTTPTDNLALTLGGCSTPGCHALLGHPPIPTASPPPLTPHHHLHRLLHRGAAVPGAVLAPDGSTVALGPVLAGIAVGLKLWGGGHIPILTPRMDPLFAVTIAEALATSFLSARGGDGATLGPGGCWDDIDNPQNYTLLGPPSLVPDAVANGAMDGVLLGNRMAKDPIGVADLLREYYGTSNSTEEGRPPSSYRRRDFGALAPPGKLEEEVLAMLRVLRALPPTRLLLEAVGEEEEAAIARRAAREFSERYVECPAIVPRCMWGARPYRGTPKPLSLPLGSIYIHHTFLPGAPCRSFAACARAMRAMQQFHQDTRGWDDIGYSFVVGSDGYIYQGRGWHWVGAHTKGHNSRGYGVGYVGDFSTALPDADTIALVRDELLPCAVRTGRLRHNYTLRGHRQMGDTDCPGDALFREIESWRGFV
ncbi:PGRP2 amidase, partial [Columbina picui]|nr:PGRP2 amidase [Columbina picui]